MAVVEIKNPSSLKVKLDIGMVNGKVKTKIKTFSNVKHSASLQDAFNVVEALVNLQEHSLMDVIKVDNTTIGA